MPPQRRLGHRRRSPHAQPWAQARGAQVVLWISQESDQEVDVGNRLRQLRIERGYSIRALAELSGLNVNTLSLIENNKTSPSVSTLQQLARALQVPISAFFDSDVPAKRIVFQKAGQRRKGFFSHGSLEDLGSGLTLSGAAPLLVTLEPGADSGPDPIEHAGIEFVFCLEGRLHYTIEGQSYVLEPGDSLIFEARLPHHWENVGKTPSRSLLVICPGEARESPAVHHFAPGYTDMGD